MRKAMVGLVAVIVLSMVSFAHAAEPAKDAATTPHGGETASAAQHPAAQPMLPGSSPLGGSMLILIAGLFLAAAIVGPVVRYHAPEEAPDVSHDEHGHGVHHAHGHDAHGAHGH